MLVNCNNCLTAKLWAWFMHSECYTSSECFPLKKLCTPIKNIYFSNCWYTPYNPVSYIFLFNVIRQVVAVKKGRNAVRWWGSPLRDWSYIRSLYISMLKRLFKPTNAWIIKDTVCFSKPWFSFLRGGICAALLVLRSGFVDGREWREDWSGGVGGYQELNCFCFHSSHCWTRLLKWPFTF